MTSGIKREASGSAAERVDHDGVVADAQPVELVDDLARLNTSTCSTKIAIPLLRKGMAMVLEDKNLSGQLRFAPVSHFFLVFALNSSRPEGYFFGFSTDIAIASV
jgi:hypothetical protein